MGSFKDLPKIQSMTLLGALKKALVVSSIGSVSKPFLPTAQVAPGKQHAYWTQASQGGLAASCRQGFVFYNSSSPPSRPLASASTLSG